jgi:hypothetical protein
METTTIVSYAIPLKKKLLFISFSDALLLSDAGLHLVYLGITPSSSL